MQKSHLTGIVAVLVTAFGLATQWAPATILPLDGETTESFTAFDNSGHDDEYGYWHEKGYWWGGWGVFSLNCLAEAEGHQFWYGERWYNVDTGTRTLDGWRKKELDICNGTKSVSWAADLAVQITGFMNMDNGLMGPLGNCAAYGYGYEALTGLDTKTIETQGSPYTAEEWDSTVGVSSPINVSLPINISNDQCNLNGDKSESSSGTKPQATDGDHIRVRGRIVGRAKTWDGAYKSDITIQTKLNAFTLTENN